MDINPFTVAVQIINFTLLYVLVLKPLVFKPLQQAMAEREATVKKNLDEAQKVVADAQQMRQQYDTRLKEAATEAGSIVSNSQKEGERIKNELIELGRKESQRLVEKAHAEIKSEREKAITEVRTHVAGLSVSMAKQLLAESLDRNAQQAIVEHMLERAGAVHGA